jgi:type VI protein secretion system component VasF
MTVTDLKTLYDRDLAAWSHQQAAALRAAARTGSNQLVDWQNLAEEIEDLGRSQRAALRSQIRRIIRHLVKLEYSRAIDPRHGWVETIGDARSEIEDLLELSPSLRAEIDRDVAAQTARAIKLAIQDLRGHGEIDDAQLQRLTAAAYSAEQVLGDWFPPQPPG